MNMMFRKALLSTGRQARKAGEISEREFRQLRRGSYNPWVMPQLEVLVAQDAEAQGLIDPILYKADGSIELPDIDWDKLVDMMREIVELIIEAIERLLNIFSAKMAFASLPSMFQLSHEHLGEPPSLPEGEKA